MRPLYREARNAEYQKGNAGLWYDKFCDLWPDDGAKGLGENKLAWIGKITGKNVGDRELMDDYRVRHTRLVNAAGGIAREGVTISRFVTGLGRAHPVENGFAWHATLGAPYLPGSSIKGLIRAWALTWRYAGDDARPEEQVRAEANEVNARLGTPGGVGDILVLDALPLAPVRLEADVMTPHYGAYYRDSQQPPGDWMSPNPVPFLVVAPGNKFHFALLPRTRTPAARAHLDQVEGWLTEALSWLGAGAKTAVGYGRFGCGALAGTFPDRWLSPVERWHQRLADKTEQEALELTRRFIRVENVSADGSDDALREALIARYYEAWAKGDKLDPATTHSSRTLKEYAAYLRPAEESARLGEAGLDADEAACIESCRGNKQRIKEIGEQIVAGTGPIRSGPGLQAFSKLAKERLAKGKKNDQQWLQSFMTFLKNNNPRER